MTHRPAPPFLRRRGGTGLALALAAGLAAAPLAADVTLRPRIELTGTGPITEAARLRVGEALQIRLPAQPSTGYSWEMRIEGPALLAPEEAACPATRTDGPVVGGAAPTCFAFRALAPGETRVAFLYRRHWETRADGLLRYEVRATIAPD